MIYRPSPTRPVVNTNGNRHPTGSTGVPNPNSYEHQHPSEFTNGGYDEVTKTPTRGPSNSGNSHSNIYEQNQGQSGNVPCGTVSIANPLITSGQKTHHGQWPWHTALYKTEGINLTYLCGGSLVSKNKVITGVYTYLVQVIFVN